MLLLSVSRVCIVSGDVLVIMDLRADDSLFEAGVAREVLRNHCACYTFFIFVLIMKSPYISFPLEF